MFSRSGGIRPLSRGFELADVKKIFYVSVGLVTVGLGVLGIFLPLLPTTPFLLLAAMCFGQSSRRCHDWLLGHPVLGPPIRDWRERGVVRTGPKVTATAMLGTSASMLFLSETAPVAGQASFGVFAAVVLLFLWTRRGA